MHELSIGRALLAQVMLVMTQRHAVAVTSITVRIGPLAGVEPALLRAAYEQLRIDTIAENAVLVILAAPVRIRCGTCTGIGEAAPNRLVCPRCGSRETTLLGGDEMLLEAVELVC